MFFYPQITRQFPMDNEENKIDKTELSQESDSPENDLVFQFKDAINSGCRVSQ